MAQKLTWYQTIETLWHDIHTAPEGTKLIPHKPREAALLEPGKYPKPSLWNIRQFMKFQGLTYFKLNKQPSLQDGNFAVFADFENTIVQNHPDKVLSTVYLMDARYEACISVIVDSLLDCLCRATGLTYRPEVVLQNTVFTNCRIDFGMYEFNNPAQLRGVVETKKVRTSFTQGLGQLFVYLVQLQSRAFGVLTDGHRFLFVKADPTGTGDCALGHEILCLKNRSDLISIIYSWLDLIRQHRSKAMAPPTHHPFLQRLQENFVHDEWKRLELHYHYQ